MHILLLGGTRFLGRHVVAALLAREHAVTLFTRGRSAPALFAQESRVTLVRGDRDGGLEALDAATRGQRFDAVVDTCGYVPRVVAASCRLLRERAGLYLFVSSISAYARMNEPGMTEDAPLALLDDPASEDVAQHYGALKAACEAVVQREFGAARALVVRPGLIVGPHDPSGRFTYWPLRLAAGGELLAPEPREAPMQLIDVRDLADWLVSLLERRIAGVFNATGPQPPLRFDAMLAACAACTASAARLVWVPASFLLEHKVAPWTELPLWLAGEEPGLAQIDAGRALAQGLRLRELRETAADTRRWVRDAGLPLASEAAGLRPEREAELLASWRRSAG